MTAIHYLIQDVFIGDLVTPRTGGHVLGFTEGPGIFVFDEPVRRFGSYFNNNSGTDDATCDFFDVDGNLLATLNAAVPEEGNVWTWNGWESDVPIARISVTGNGIIDGFLWFDDLEASTIPSPGGAGAMGVLALAGFRRRRSRPTAEA
jgi:MYXO-CTERM domain-containing protein